MFMPTMTIIQLDVKHTRFALCCLLALVLVLGAYFDTPFGHRNPHKGLLCLFEQERALTVHS